MTATILCALAFAVTYWAGKRSLGLGVVSLLACGYFYGILRANLLGFSYFLFDAALLGVYLSQWRELADPGDVKRLAWLRLWVALLVLWPILLIFMPFQPIMISLVGFRGNALFIPMALLGARLRGKDIVSTSVGLACLNLVALAFGGAEYFLGLQNFYPYNASTALIFGSEDVAGGFHRIPAIFVNAHSYGGTTVATLPFLLGSWRQSPNYKVRVLVLFGIAAALLGVLLSATRLNFILATAMTALTISFGRIRTTGYIAFTLLIAAVLWVAMTNERLQRFMSLSDTEYVENRISGSLNRGFFEILLEHPMGNGLGGGGTSIPYFLEGQVRNPISMENEYARILAEQGVVGLMLWLGFIAWFLSCFQNIFAKGPWATGRRLAWSFSVLALGTGLIGTGLFTAIPGTAILVLGMGWTAAVGLPDVLDKRDLVLSKAAGLPRLRPRPEYTL